MTRVRRALIKKAASRPWPVLAIILTSYFMILLDNSVVFTGLPSIRADLDLSDTGLSWVQDAYTLVFGGRLLLASRAGDIVGRERLFVVGLIVFGTASALIGFAPTGWWIMAARALQGIGAAIVAPTSLALITAYFDGETRAKAVAWYGATAGIGASLGLVVGGALTELVSWRAAFLVNVPIAVAMVFAARAVLLETPRQQRRFDAAGAILATLGVGARCRDDRVRRVRMVVNRRRGRPRPRRRPARSARRQRGACPAADHAVAPLREPPAQRGVCRAAAYLGAMIGFFYFTTQLMQDTFGFTALQAGLGFLSMSLVNFGVALSIPRLGRMLSTPALLAAGTFTTLVGMAWLSRAGGDDSYLRDIAAPMVLIGGGQGLVFAPLTSAGIWGVEPKDAGAASGLLNTAYQLGMALGLGALVAISARAGGDSSDPALLVAERFGAALTGSTVLLAGALAVVLEVIVPAGRSARHQMSAPVPAESITPARRSVS